MNIVIMNEKNAVSLYTIAVIIGTRKNIASNRSIHPRTLLIIEKFITLPVLSQNFLYVFQTDKLGNDNHSIPRLNDIVTARDNHRLVTVNGCDKYVVLEFELA